MTRAVLVHCANLLNVCISLPDLPSVRCGPFCLKSEARSDAELGLEEGVFHVVAVFSVITPKLGYLMFLKHEFAVESSALPGAFHSR